jgi:hypothetical protein
MVSECILLQEGADSTGKEERSRRSDSERGVERERGGGERQRERESLL